MNVSFPALCLKYATRLLANNAAGWANCLQLQICFLLTCAIHEFIPIMITERLLSTGLGKLKYTQKSIACSLFFSLYIRQDAPPTIILKVISMTLTLLYRLGRVLHSIFLYLWEAGSSGGATPSFICCLSTALAYQVSENNCSKISLFMGLNALLIFTWLIWKKMINVHLIFLPCAASWANICTHQFFQLVLMGLKCLLTKMPAADLVEAVGHGGLSQGLGIWTLCTLIPCMLAMLHFQSCEALQLPLDLRSSVTRNYNAGKSQRFMNLWYIPCHYENRAAWHSQHFINKVGQKRPPWKLCSGPSDLFFLSLLSQRNVFICTATWWTENLNSVHCSCKVWLTLDHVQSSKLLVHWLSRGCL